MSEPFSIPVGAYAARPTTDGRVVRRDALTWRLPLRLLLVTREDRLPRHVGTVRRLAWVDPARGRSFPVLRGDGDLLARAPAVDALRDAAARARRGRLPVCLNVVSYSEEWAEEDDLHVLREGSVLSFTVDPDAVPAWPECYLRLGAPQGGRCRHCKRGRALP